MRRESDSIIHPLVIRQRSVSCLVSKCPQAGHKNALPMPVCCPKRPTENERDTVAETTNFAEDLGERFYHAPQLECHQEKDNVSDVIADPFGGRLVEQLLRYRGMDFSN